MYLNTVTNFDLSVAVQVIALLGSVASIVSLVLLLRDRK